MRRPIIFAGLLLIVSCVLGATAFRDQAANGAARAQPPTPVSFTNTSGTSTGNTVKIDPASNAISGSVGITGTPSVGLASGANTVKIDPANNTVALANSPTSPLSVANVNDGQHPYGKECLITFAGNQTHHCTFGSLSSGTTLVVDSISMWVEVQSGAIPEVSDFEFDSGGAAGTRDFMPLTKIGSDNTFDYYEGAENLRTYTVGADSTLCSWSAAGDLSFSGVLVCDISGYLVKTS